MIPAIKAEFRKLLTVRSTYIIFGLSLLFVAFMAGYIFGYRADAIALRNPSGLTVDIFGAVGSMTVIGALVAILLFSHEYRYSTIMYTLTSSNSRSKILLAKVLIVTAFSIVFTLAIGAFSALSAWTGIQLHGHSLGSQTVDIADLLWRCLFYGWAYAMIGLMLVGLFRHQIVAIATLFIVPVTLEPILSLLLKENRIYLPFTALSGIVNQAGGAVPLGNLTPTKAALIVSVYLVVGWAVTWLLFLRRDAN